MPKPIPVYQHQDRLGQNITVDSIVAFCYSGGTTIHIGRVIRLTAKRVRVVYTYEYTNHSGDRVRWKTDYQAHPDRVLVLNQIEQQLTVLALKGAV
jgi:hypothetical protein